VSRRNVRGQATTELALGSLVFVVVLMFGIYFGEVPVMMLKVKEAANFSVTHATGSRTHMFNGANINSGSTYAPFDPAQSGTDTRARYRDFDGMSDRSGTGTFSQVMTSASRLRARCRSDSQLEFEVDRPGGTHRDAAGKAKYDAAFDFLSSRYKDRGGVKCEIAAEATPFRLPTSFVDTGSGKMAEETLNTRASLKICGAGRPTNNTCKGELIVLTGDWGFDGPMGSKVNGDAVSVQEDQVENDPYVRFVRELYERNGKSQGKAGRDLIEVVAGLRPSDREYLDESVFNMSFKGANVVAAGGIKVERFKLDDSILRYQTSGADMRSNYVGWGESSGFAPNVRTCFLGLSGCAE
jgi:hypothetical protein